MFAEFIPNLKAIKKSLCRKFFQSTFQLLGNVLLKLIFLLKKVILFFFTKSFCY